MESRGFTLYELMLTISHVKESNIHESHLNQLAFNIGSELSLVTVRLVLDQIHQTWNHNYNWNKHLNLIRSYPEELSREDDEDLPYHYGEFIQVLPWLVSIEEEAITGIVILDFVLFSLWSLYLVMSLLDEIMFVMNLFGNVKRN